MGFKRKIIPELDAVWHIEYCRSIAEFGVISDWGDDVSVVVSAY